MTIQHSVYLSLGSNINKGKNISECLSTLADSYGKLIISSVYESEAIGFTGEPFFNMVVGIQTSQSVGELSTSLRQIESNQGRERSGPKFSGRSLDIDILLYDDLEGVFDGVLLPREEITENAYVLWPLAEIAGQVVLPGTRSKVATLWSKYDKAKQQLRPVPFRWRDASLPQPPINVVSTE